MAPKLEDASKIALSLPITERGSLAITLLHSLDWQVKEEAVEQARDTKAAWQEAEAWGCDMSLIEANLELSYRERCEQHDRAINQAMALRQAALAQINGLSSAIKTTSER